MSVNKEGQIVQSPYRFGHIGDDAMGDEVDWDSLTFSLTPTDTMYITTTDIDSPWDIGELIPYGHENVTCCWRSKLRTRAV